MKPDSLADAIAGDPMFSVDEKGRPVMRQRTCGCGRGYTQRLLSERFLGIVEKQSKRAIGFLSEQIPGFWVPVHCPSCESRDLGRQARIDEAKREQHHFTDREETADD
jgi:hypothetical protein